MSISIRSHWLASLCLSLGFLVTTDSLAQNLLAQNQSLTLSVGQAHVLNESHVKRIAVGNGKILQATALDEKQILVIPEAPGQSTLHLWNKQGGEKVIVINVVPSDANRLLSEVSGMLGEGTGVSTRIVGDKVVLEGTQLSEATSLKVQEIAKRYPSIVNLVSKFGNERMIAIDVRMVEIRRDAMQNIGVKWAGQSQGPSFGIVGDLNRSDRLRPNGAAAGVTGAAVQPYVSPFGTAISLVSNITSMLNFMVQSGDAVILAEPRLSARSGGEARFIAGGELPIPVSTGLGQTSVSFKEYGVKFDIKPTASENGMISARIATEISALNFDVMIKDIPGLSKRRAETDVNLRENETLIIAGLVTDDMSRHVDKVPALGDVPILGKLFRSKQFREQQTELIVMITPRFVTGEVNASFPSFASQRPNGSLRDDRNEPNPGGRSAPVASAAAAESKPVQPARNAADVREKLRAIRQPIEMLE
jgi:pilus assembly protein CpaC